MLDVRGEILYREGHIKNAINLPHSQITAERLDEFDKDILMVVYCARPHCNATEKAAIKLANHHYQVKKMIRGITGWLNEGFVLTK